MPNYCDCELDVRGNPKDLKRFMKFAKNDEQVFDFNRFIPYPEKFEKLDRLANLWYQLRRGKINVDDLTEEEMAFLLKHNGEIKDGYNSGGYEWCINNWGTKWNACNPTVVSSLKGDVLFYRFDTAWSPPIPVIIKASKMFPELIFELRYWEIGAGYKGRLVAKAGKVLVNEFDNHYVGECENPKCPKFKNFPTEKCMECEYRFTRGG